MNFRSSTTNLIASPPSSYIPQKKKKCLKHDANNIAKIIVDMLLVSTTYPYAQFSIYTTNNHNMYPIKSGARCMQPYPQLAEKFC